MSNAINKYFRMDKLPHIWCPGCGHGILLRCVVEAIDRCNLDKDKVCVVSGIGCSSRAAGYVDFNTLHTAHGRALAFATGIKMANPELTVIVITGDGDAMAIGGNHLIHAARRNIDITTVIFDNRIYGMTGGQYSPTTHTGGLATTAPHGNIDQPFNSMKVADAAGATYLARGTVYMPRNITNYIERGIKNKGFSLIEGVSSCPTYYGRKNMLPTAVDILKSMRDHSVDVKAAANMTEDELEGKIITGEFKNITRKEYTEQYDIICSAWRGMVD